MKRNIIREAIEKPEKHPLTFIFVITLALGVAVNGLSDLVFNLLGEQITHLLGISKSIWQGIVVFLLVASILLGISNIWSRLRKLFQRSTTVDQIYVLELQQTFPGLIVMMSLGIDSPAKRAIEHHWNNGNGDLAHCWLICTEKSLPIAEELVNQFVDRGIPRRFFHYGDRYQFPDSDNRSQHFSLFVDLAHEHDPNYICRLINSLYLTAETQYRLPETEIIADYTGGTKSATAGTVLACTRPGRKLQYIMSEYVNNKPINSKVMEVRIAYNIEPIFWD
ncbi:MULTISPECIES: CRISPR-associated protein [Leptolyngbya]|uniref:CRISPR-associated protein n=1 Tax=Leptolyngbya TaxID=47251 RepID=UPI0016881B46|nr:CRISPR-associated protein [Leptolyngbya sp. FACHB-1624]MBD1858246.1 CRISPR-associated protein [Leptolyngbya sp. FACHB-1624]